jgi:hypothetical protein
LNCYLAGQRRVSDDASVGNVSTSRKVTMASRNDRPGLAFGLAVTIGLFAAACSSGSTPADEAGGSVTTVETTPASTPPGTSVAASGLPGQVLTKIATTPVGFDYQAALPVMGVDGSLVATGANLPAKGHVFAKPGTTVSPTPDGKGLELKAQNLAGYIDTKSGRKLAYAVMVNNAGAVNPEAVAASVSAVFNDEGTISNYLYENL